MTTDATARTRYFELKRILEERRAEILAQVQERMREQSVDNGPKDVRDSESGEGGDDIDFALMQMKRETVYRLGEALQRLEKSQFGHCMDCGGEISERRLRALPFAVRCKDCEEQREVDERRERIKA